VRIGQVHFHRPPEGTLQLLPGRLEILAGTDRVDEIRFLKLPGREAAVTFGRSRGEPHAHVQLEAPTVSRLHARMSYQGGRWRIANLSSTNPILVNGEQLPLEPDVSALLEDGDRVEMGQVIFRFRMR
jgi:pSer/pThr/pTyr-binding forkhead associated (FHA) protein